MWELIHSLVRFFHDLDKKLDINDNQEEKDLVERK